MKNSLETERNRISRIVERLEKELNKLPEGILECHKNNKSWNWYAINKEQTEDGKVIRNKTYIKRSNRNLAEKLAERGYLEAELTDYKQELKAVDMYPRHRSKFERGKNYLDRAEEYRNLTSVLLNKKWPENIQEWLNDKYQGEKLYPEHLTHRCKNGMYVRSKSEAFIVDALDSHNVPFKYEEPIILKGERKFPDFTILSQRDGKEYLWEHFGKMDDPKYLESNMKKILNYIESGYIPFVNIIMTFETKNSSIDSMWIDRIIENFFV